MKFVIVFIYLAINLVNGQINIPLSSDEKLDSINKFLKYESDSANQFLIYRGFIVKYNKKQKSPHFTIHFLSPEQLDQSQPKAKRMNSFWIDDFHKTVTATKKDYYKSGFDRGHFVPAGDYYWDKDLKDETFVMSNISPQKPGLNRGIFALLENKLREMVRVSNLRMCIITGSIFIDSDMGVFGNNKIGIPSFFYKICFLENSNILIAFLFPHANEFHSVDLKDYQVDVNSLERITNEDFFDKFDDDYEEKIESNIIYYDEIE
ncbi:MAG: DNA/RNA non-specific endonuclease [Calditrichaeota bacterium]|nr:MAG: DNA/RNA non-specific endonuclease [Calditrichota bacterium]MBL1208056.1 DNA/RNA non-specific endonuclease [Calditrichota bacterium]NOG47892.1 DNA/RNA non-specific endonuclease [Calditrichota bacterium]